MFYDDVNNKLIIRPRKHILHRTVDIPELNLMYPFFRSSLILEWYWKDSIDVEMGDEKYSYEGKEYDLSKDNIEPWILGSSVLMRG